MQAVKKCILAGYGYWGNILMRYLKDAGFETEAVYTRRSNVSFDDLLGSSESEYVFICTPVSSHYEYVKKALLSGKHVFCEKMLTGSLEQAEELYSIARSCGRILFTDYIYLYSPSVRKMYELKEQTGKIFLLDSCISQFGRFYSDADVIGNIGVHMISACGYLTDFAEPDPETIQLDIHHRGFQKVSSMADVSFSYKSGAAVIRADASVLSGRKVRTIRVLADSGEMLFDMNGKPSLKVSFFKQMPEISMHTKEYDLDEGNNLKNSLEAFSLCLKDHSCSTYLTNKKCSLYTEKINSLLHRY